MGPPNTNDFNLDSEGHCFFCLNMIPIKVNQGDALGTIPKFQNISVHYLARYLGMDMGKVLIDQEQIDSTLLTKVRRSRLNVELCDKCTSLNNTFSALYRQLEKLEIEITSNLRLIHGELLAADRKEKIMMTLASHPSMRNEISQIVDVLRDEAIQKCSRKLPVLSPRVQIKRLTKKQIAVELPKRQMISGITKMEPHNSSRENSIEWEDDVKMELEPQYENLLPDDDVSSEMDDEPPKTSEDLRSKVQNISNELAIISSASSSTNKVGEIKFRIDRKTRKWKCASCPMAFTSWTGVSDHHRSVHENIRFKCIPCGKEFARRTAYNRHHRSVHVGVRFKCLVCNNLFIQKVHLQRHQRGTRCRR